MTQPPRAAPHELWRQANGDRDEYLRLMRQAGHIVPDERSAGEDIFGHHHINACPDPATCGEPHSYSQPPRAPRTAAGRALLAGMSGIAAYRPRGRREVVGIREAILAIEAEAEAAGSILGAWEVIEREYPPATVLRLHAALDDPEAAAATLDARFTLDQISDALNGELDDTDGAQNLIRDVLAALAAQEPTP